MVLQLSPISQLQQQDTTTERREKERERKRERKIFALFSSSFTNAFRDLESSICKGVFFFFLVSFPSIVFLLVLLIYCLLEEMNLFQFSFPIGSISLESLRCWCRSVAHCSVLGFSNANFNSLLIFLLSCFPNTWFGLILWERWERWKSEVSIFGFLPSSGSWGNKSIIWKVWQLGATFYFSYFFFYNLSMFSFCFWIGFYFIQLVSWLPSFGVLFLTCFSWEWCFWVFCYIGSELLRGLAC